MFETLSVAPPDAIFGLNEAMRRDSRPEKINLGAGVYKDEAGKTPVLRAVKAAEERLVGSERSKVYLPIEGSRAYAREVKALLFGREPDGVERSRLATVQAPGGTGALRLAADFLKRVSPPARVWLSDPTWPNHPQIFEAAGLSISRYPYFDTETNGLALGRLRAALAEVSAGDVVVLHGCCHNPTGIDPSASEWQGIAESLAEVGALPVVDFAYQGFARDLEADAEGIRILARAVPEMVVCSSFSKNFGLYNERVGALTLVARTEAQARSAQSQIKVCARSSYSNPPAHGSAIVSAVLSDPNLHASWRRELAGMRERIRRMRQLFAEGLDARGVFLHGSDNQFITRQNGMFSFSRLGVSQVRKLRDDHAIYLVDSGRLNVAGMTETTMDRLCDAVSEVIRGAE